jgi:hypothetical protein
MIRYFSFWATGSNSTRVRIAMVLALAACATPRSLWGADAGPIPNGLLDRTGERVKDFWDDLSSVACTETLIQEKLSEKGKVILNSRSSYDYLISLRWNGSDLIADESRLEQGPPQKRRPETSLLATRGFATMLLVLHPDFQSSYSFSLLPDDSSKLVRIGFVPRNGARSPGALELKGREYPIAWEGTAWIDRASATVARIDAHWREPAAEIGLESLASDVRYGPVLLRDHNFWLPEAAHIEVKTRHQHWRNSHQFTRYKLFSVDADSKVEQPKVSPDR